MNNQNKIILGIIAVLLVVGISVVLVVNQENTDDPNVIKVGANLSLTGPMAYWSTELKNGLDIAADHFSGDGITLKLVYEDNNGQARGGLSALQKLRSENICAVITAHTSIAQALQDSVAQMQIPLIGTIVGVSDFGAKNEWSFLDWPTHEDVTPPLVDYITKSLHAQSAVILVVDDDYGKVGATVFSELFASAGGRVVGVEFVRGGETNVRNVLTKLMNLNPDVLYTVTREETLVAVIRMAGELGFDGHIVGEHSMASSNVAANAPVNIEIIFAGSKGIAEIAQVAPDFAESYEKRFGKTPDWVSLYGYSIGEYLFPIVMESRGNPEAIRQMLSVLNTTTIRGKVIMSEDRKVSTQAIVYSRKGNQLIIVSQ